MNSNKTGLTKEQIELLVEIIKNNPKPSFELKDTLGLPSDFTFGFEIEAAGIYKDTIIEKFSKNRLSKLGYRTQGESSMSDECEETWENTI